MAEKEKAEVVETLENLLKASGKLALEIAKKGKESTEAEKDWMLAFIKFGMYLL